MPFIVRLEDVSDGETMGLFGRSDGDTGVRPVTADALRENMLKTVSTLRKAFADVGEQHR